MYELCIEKILNDGKRFSGKCAGTQVVKFSLIEVEYQRGNRSVHVSNRGRQPSKTANVL